MLIRVIRVDLWPLHPFSSVLLNSNDLTLDDCLAYCAIILRDIFVHALVTTSTGYTS